MAQLAAAWGEYKDGDVVQAAEMAEKLAGELAVKEVCASGNLPLIVIRPRTILGEGRLGIFQIFAARTQSSAITLLQASITTLPVA